MWCLKLQSPGHLILIAVFYHIPLPEWHLKGRDTNGTLFDKIFFNQPAFKQRSLKLSRLKTSFFFKEN